MNDQKYWNNLLTRLGLGMDRGVHKWLLYGADYYSDAKSFSYVKTTVLCLSSERKAVLAARAREWRKKNKEHYRLYKNQRRLKEKEAL